jgi:hypothetical protein
MKLRPEESFTTISLMDLTQSLKKRTRCVAYKAERGYGFHVALKRVLEKRQELEKEETTKTKTQTAYLTEDEK